jgi:hypothetical protein
MCRTAKGGDPVATPGESDLRLPSDWLRKLSQKNPFISKVNAEPKIFVLGSNDELERL